MSSPLKRALGPDWDRLPPALQAHYRDGASTELGHLDIDYPRAMQPVLSVLRCIGALVNRRGQRVATTVVKQMAGGRQHWSRRLRFDDGREICFNSTCVPGGPGRLIEYVNPVLGLEMQPFLVGRQLRYRGLGFVVKIGPWTLTIPQWLGPGVTSITEDAIDEHRFAMDFRLTHPWLGELFRYAGTFEVDAGGQAEAGRRPDPRRASVH